MNVSLSKTHPTPSCRFWILGLLVACLTVGCETPEETQPTEPETTPASTTESAPESEHASFYTVDHYDLEADPAEQLAATLKRAQAENRTVLLQVGGDWCGWCNLMTKYIEDTQPVHERLAANYLIQKVTFDQKNKNEAFLSDYPKIGGYPHIFVLSPSGELLHSQDTAELEEGKGYSEEAFVAFLDKWKPEAK